MRAMFSMTFDLTMVPIAKEELGRKAVKALILKVFHEKDIQLLVDGHSWPKK